MFLHTGDRDKSDKKTNEGKSFVSNNELQDHEIKTSGNTERTYLLWWRSVSVITYKNEPERRRYWSYLSSADAATLQHESVDRTISPPP